VAIGIARILEPVIHILWLEPTVERDLREWALPDDDRGCTNADPWHYSLCHCGNVGYPENPAQHISTELIYNYIQVNMKSEQAESKAKRHIE